MSFAIGDALETVQAIRRGDSILAGELADTLEAACAEVERLRLANPRQSTVERLRFERDKLRSEVVRLRGQWEHDYVVVEDTPLGDAMRFRCRRCGKETTTPTHAYFDPCRRQLPFPVLDEG